MSILRSSFSFLLGTVTGVYVAQNYDVPNIRNLATTYFVKAKEVEETYRKPGSKREDGD